MSRLNSVGDMHSKWFYCNPVVSISSAGLIWAFVIYCCADPATARETFSGWQSWVTDVWNWMYLISQNVWIGVLLYCLYKYFHLKLGKEDDVPEFSDGAYFAMLFSCGLATGLWFYTAEAMWHYEGYGTPRWMDTQMFNLNTRAEHAMVITYFHWGLHGWIPYCCMGAITAILHYRRNFPLSMRWTLYPLIGEMCYGIIGDMVEILSILCTIFGVCTSLGLGAMQINKGLVRLDRGTYRGVDAVPEGNVGITFGPESQIVIIIGVTALATMSVVVGLKSGIAVLSQIAFVLGLFILGSVCLMDNPWYILNANTSALGYYIWMLPKMSFHTDAWEELGSASDGMGGAPDDKGGAKGWMNGWTIFYWGWWISWGPFVGAFLARISKGRKLGTFILATLIIPSLWSFAFVGVFGAAQIRISNQAITATQHCVSQLPASSGITVDSDCYITGYCENCTFTYGSTADKNVFGWMQQDEEGNDKWVEVPDTVTRLYNLGTEDVLFEQLQTYGGKGWSTFTCVITLICIILYFVTSSDSASFVVDMLAANGRAEPPITQKVFWALTEGMAAAICILVGGENQTDALKALQAVPIVLGLPYTFHLFCCCQSLIIVCKEESGELSPNRKNFTNFLLFNGEPMSFLSFLLPCVPAGLIAHRTLGGSKASYLVGYGFLWLWFILLCFLTIADVAFSSMAAAAFLVFGMSVGFLRGAVRNKVGITGDLISDMVCSMFWLPFALGQMYGEDLDAVPPPQEAKKPQTIGNADAKQVDI
jgi:choline-glycine betaine transporter